MMNPTRLTLARKRKGLTKTAEKIVVIGVWRGMKQESIRLHRILCRGSWLLRDFLTSS
jgi:hypothetical protein